MLGSVASRDASELRRRRDAARGSSRVVLVWPIDDRRPWFVWMASESSVWWLVRLSGQNKNGHKSAKTYNTEDSPVVTDLSTSSAISSLSRGERTGSRVLYYVWSYVLVTTFAVPFLSRLVCGCCDGWLQHGGRTTRQPSAWEVGCLGVKQDRGIMPKRGTADTST